MRAAAEAGAACTKCCCCNFLLQQAADQLHPSGMWLWGSCAAAACCRRVPCCRCWQQGTHHPSHLGNSCSCTPLSWLDGTAHMIPACNVHHAWWPCVKVVATTANIRWRFSSPSCPTPWPWQCDWPNWLGGFSQGMQQRHVTGATSRHLPDNTA